MREKYDDSCLHCQVAKFIHKRGGLKDRQAAAQAITHLAQAIGEICDLFPNDRDLLVRATFVQLGDQLGARVSEVEAEEDERAHLH